jgi:hypothetical protein
MLGGHSAMPSDTDFDYDFGTPIQTMNGLIGHYCLDATPIGARLWGWDEPQRAQSSQRDSSFCH